MPADNYVIFPRRIIFACNLLPSTKAVLLVLAAFGPNTTVSIAYVCEAVGLSDRTVRSAIKEAKDLGYLVVHHVYRADGGCCGNRYEVLP